MEKKRLPECLSGYEDFVSAAVSLMEHAPSGTAFTVSYIDITGFKKFNDCYGFAAGDKLLSALGERLLGMFRTVVCSRVFSDHFLRLAQYDPQADTVPYLVENMERVLRDLEAQELLVYPDCVIHFSCGYCMVDSPDREKLVRAVDDANLARKGAKAAGRTAAVWFDQSFRDQVTEQEQLEVEIRSGLRHDQFHFYLQPKVDLHTGEIVGAEALTRWTRPDGREVSPERFIPLMEQNDLILELDHLIFRKVCKYFRQRIARGEKLVPISVNMSRRHIPHRDFPQRLRQMAEEYGVPPCLLEIELTETVLFSDLEEARWAMSQLREYGFHVSIDDFGSGYTSINLWRNLDFDLVKLDKTYIMNDDDKLQSLRNDIVVSSIAYISRKFKTTLLCEGPETAEQCAHMAAMGCDVAQGYYFSKALPPDDFNRLLEQGRFPLPYKSKTSPLPKSEETLLSQYGHAQTTDLMGYATFLFHPETEGTDRFRCLDLNQPAVELCGLPDKAAMLERGLDPIRDFVAPQDLEGVLMLLRNLSSHDDPEPVAFRLVAVDRTVRNLSGLIRHMTGSKGGSYYLLSVFDDTHWREVQQFRLDLSAMVEDLPGGLLEFSIDLETGALGTRPISHHFADPLGYSPEEYALFHKAGLQWNLLPEVQRGPCRSAALTAAEAKAPLVMCFFARKKRGGMLWLCLSAAFHHEKDGVAYYTGTLVDLSEYAPAGVPPEPAPMALWSYDFETDTLYLPMTEASTGLPLSGTVQMSLAVFWAQDIMAPEDKDTLARLYRTLRETGEAKSGTVTMKTADGQHCPFLLTCRPTAWDDAGRTIEVVGSSTRLQ